DSRAPGARPRVAARRRGHRTSPVATHLPHVHRVGPGAAGRRHAGVPRSAECRRSRREAPRRAGTGDRAGAPGAPASEPRGWAGAVLLTPEHFSRTSNPGGELAMDKFAAAGLAFLLAVLWFDLMFDT